MLGLIGILDGPSVHMQVDRKKYLYMQLLYW